tara:strand:- start:12498 stop:13058 length:561 start_codon:yes stop_codon:yes gene_type:complete
MKIAISGKMGSGKSFVAEKIVEEFGYYKTALAAKVKELAGELFDMKYKNRGLLINFATKMREIDSYVWINCVLRETKDISDNIVLDDLRLQNEYETLKSKGWFLIKIDIPEEIRLHRLVEKYGTKFVEHQNHFQSFTENDVVTMNDNCFDLVIKNDDDMTELFEKIRTETSNLELEKNFKFGKTYL